MDGVAGVQALLDAVQRRDGQVVRSGRRLRGDRRRAVDAGGPDQRGRRLERRAQRRDRDGRAALPARRRRCHDPLRRREAPRRPRAPPAPASGPAAPRRAHEPPRRGIGRMAGALPRRVQRHGRRRHPRPLLPRQRRESGSSSSTAAEASRSRATTRAGWSRSSPAWRTSRSRPTRGSERSPASSSGCAWAPRRDRRKARPALRRTNSSSPRPTTRRPPQRELEIAIPPGPRLGDQVIEVAGPAQGLRRPPADRGPDVLPAALRHRRDHRAERGREDDAVPDARRPGDARRRHHRRSATRSR